MGTKFQADMPSGRVVTYRMPSVQDLKTHGLTGVTEIARACLLDVDGEPPPEQVGADPIDETWPLPSADTVCYVSLIGESLEVPTSVDAMLAASRPGPDKDTRWIPVPAAGVPVEDSALWVCVREPTPAMVLNSRKVHRVEQSYAQGTTAEARQRNGDRATFAADLDMLAQSMEGAEVGGRALGKSAAPAEVYKDVANIAALISYIYRVMNPTDEQYAAAKGSVRVIVD